MKTVAVYSLVLVGVIYVCATWPRVVAGVYAASCGILLLGLLAHHAKRWLGLR